MERSISMPLGVVVERRELEHRWQKHGWRPVAVIPGAPETADWRELRRGEGWIRYHAATLPLELHRKETEAYAQNLTTGRPAIYVVLRPDEARDALREVQPFLVTASPYQAQDYTDSDDLVEAVPMPEGVVAWLQAFVDRHHVVQPFRKRRREPHDVERSAFGPPARTRGPDRMRAGRRPRGGSGRG
jgi:hypothetical protein